MKQPLQVVFGDDGSAAADVVWLWLNSHVWPGWEVAVIHAQLPDLSHFPPDEEAAALHEWQPPQPRPVFGEAGFATVRYLTAIADPRVALLSCKDTRLIVVGPHGPGLLKAVHLGSTTEWLLVRPPAPLLIVKSARPVRSVLACVDGSPHSRRAVRALAELPWLSTVGVTVLGVEDGRAEVRPAVADAAAELQPVAGDVRTQIGGPPVTAAIHDIIDRAEVDLVVLGTRGNTGLKHLVLGSTASHVARAARCCVLIACDQSGSDS